MSVDLSLRHPDGGVEIGACFPVMHQLRPMLANAEALVA